MKRFLYLSKRQRLGRSMNIQHHTYCGAWSPDDNEHFALCAEFPSLSWLTKTPQATLKGIQSVVDEAVTDILASGEPVPTALAEKKYSSEFRVRIPPMVQRQLAMMPAEQGVSLNRLASAKLVA